MKKKLLVTVLCLTTICGTTVNSFASNFTKNVSELITIGDEINKNTINMII